MGSFAAVAFRPRSPDPEVVTRMLAAAPHRGSSVEIVLSGHSVIGVSRSSELETAWLGRDNGLVAAFVGDLDNHDELAAELSLPRDPAPVDPAKVAIGAYRRWGGGFAKRLRGRFSGVIAHETGLLAFRDHLGLETLFYREEDCSLLASEAKQVVAGARISREPDLDGLANIFYGRLPPEQTALKGVRRFPMASVGHFGDGAPTIERYWDPSRLLETARLSPTEIRERLVELFDQAVRRTITGEDGISLSGGIDSPTVAAFAVHHHRKLSGRPPLALTAVYPDHPSVDERSYVELVAEHLGLPLHTYVPAARPLDDTSHWVDVLDGPVDTLSIPEVAENYRAARELGVSTLLTGELAEYVYAIQQHLGGHLLLHGRWGPLAHWIATERARGRTLRRVARTLAPSVAPAFLAERYVRLRRRDNRGIPAWIDPVEVGGLGNRPDLRRPARRRWAESQLDPLWGGGSISMEADAICASLFGLRVRRPLVDVDLWEFFLSLPAEAKFPEPLPKALVRETIRGRVPDALLDRRDQTLFDAHYLDAADYPALRRLILGSSYRMQGVDYKLLRERLERHEMGLHELFWANDLARVHAFASLWE